MYLKTQWRERARITVVLECQLCTRRTSDVVVGVFLVALQPVLLQLQKEFPDVLVLAYCGNKNLIGDAPRVSLPTSAVAGC